MKRTRLLVCACFMLATTSLAVAQQPTRLLIEVTVDGSLVARPELRVPSGSDGHVEISNAPNPRLSGLRETITVTPTVRGDDVAIAFKISSGGKPTSCRAADVWLPSPHETRASSSSPVS